MAVLDQQGGLIFGLFMMGLIGGASHCAGMCGPFVLSQVAARLETRPVSQMREWHRLAGAAVLPYHLGRATTYAALGGAAALAAGSLSMVPGLKWLSAGLLLLAAILLLGLAVPKLKMALPGGAKAEALWSSKVSEWAKPLFRSPTGLRGYGLGLALGFIPCGLLYGAIAAAAASGSALGGIMAMLAFSAGTIPSLLAVGLVGHFAASRFRATVFRYAPLLLVLNAGVLSFMAWRLVA